MTQDTSHYTINVGKSLDFLVQAAQVEYAQVLFERRSMQYGLAKQYLWIASLVISGAATLWTQRGDVGGLVVAGLAIAVATAVAAFIFSLRTLRGKGMDTPPYNKWWKGFAEMAYSYPPETIQQGMLENLDTAIREGYAVTTERALNLRRVCNLLVFSVVMLIVAVVIYGLGASHAG